MKCFLEEKSEAFVTLLRGCIHDKTSLFLSLSPRVYHQNLYQNDFNMTASSFSEGGKGGEEGKEEEEERDVMSRAERELSSVVHRRSWFWIRRISVPQSYSGVYVPRR